MKISKLAAAGITVAMSLAAGNALAAKSCNIVGTYTDTLGSTIVFKTLKAGTAKNAAICAATYKLKVTKNTQKAIDVTGKAKGCGNLSADFVPNYPTCTTATGTVTITGLGTFNDTITKESKARVTPDTSALQNGLR